LFPAVDARTEHNPHLAGPDVDQFCLAAGVDATARRMPAAGALPHSDGVERGMAIVTNRFVGLSPTMALLRFGAFLPANRIPERDGDKRPHRDHE